MSARGESRAHPFEPQAEPVTVTVARRVAAGREADFEDWSDELTAVAANFPGFLGAGRLRPNRVGEPWHVVFRFDSALHLQDWEDSAERQTLLAEGEHLVEATDMHRVSGLETWFSLPGRTAPAPPKWKMFLVSATVFYLLNLTLSLSLRLGVRRLAAAAAHRAGVRSGDGDRDLAGRCRGRRGCCRPGCTRRPAVPDRPSGVCPMAGLLGADHLPQRG